VIHNPLWPCLALAVILAGCAGSSQGDRVNTLEQRVSEQETRLTRLNQTVSAGESKIDYIQSQVERVAGSGGGATAGREEVAKSQVHFDRNRYDLSADAQKSVDDLAGKLTSDPYSTVEIKGFTDGLGSPEYNYFLGERRAETVARYLNTKHGIPLYRMERISYGKDAAVSAGRGDQEDPASRRVEMRILSNTSRQGKPNIP
jgi:outer membrane protein OmpA-like peptidoglycan-associated protein